jgi:hypothetical protein
MPNNYFDVLASLARGAAMGARNYSHCASNRIPNRRLALTADTSEPTSLEGSSMSAAAKATEVRHPATRMYSSRLPPSEKLKPDEAQAALDALAAHKAPVSATEATELLKLRLALQAKV